MGWFCFSTALLLPPHKEVEELWPGSVFLCTQTAQSQFMTCQKLFKWPRINSYLPKSSGLLSTKVSMDKSTGGCWWAAAECSSAGLQVTEASSTWLLTWEISDQKCHCTELPWEASTWKGVRQESSFPSLWIKSYLLVLPMQEH